MKTVSVPAGFKEIRKVVVLIVGSLVVLAGLAMLVLPGPAFVVIPVGFAILATEFEWARRWMQATLKFLKHATEKVQASSRPLVKWLKTKARRAEKAKEGAKRGD